MSETLAEQLDYQAIEQLASAMRHYITCIRVDNQLLQDPGARTIYEEEGVDFHDEQLHAYSQLVELGTRLPDGGEFQEAVRPIEAELKEADQERIDEQARIDREEARLSRLVKAMAGADRNTETYKIARNKAQQELDELRTHANLALSLIDSGVSDAVEQFEAHQAVIDMLEPWPIPLTLSIDERRELGRQALAELARRQPVVEEVLPEPDVIAADTKKSKYEQLADQITDLSEQLLSAVSAHPHLYGQIRTAKHFEADIEAKFQAAKDPSKLELNDDEKMFLAVRQTLRNRFMAGRDVARLFTIFTPDEVLELNRRFLTLKRNRSNRPDFRELEGKILERAGNYIHLVGTAEDKDLVAARKRMEQDADGRAGLTFGKLFKFAERGCDAMRQHMRGENASHYAFDVWDKRYDPDKHGKHNYTLLYQFIMDDYALEVMGKRRSAAQQEARHNFLQNCEAIERWLADNDELLKQIPSDLHLVQYRKNKADFRIKTFTGRRAASDVTYERVGAEFSIRQMVKHILARRDGKETRGIEKSMVYGVTGALNHTLRLAYCVRQLKVQLAQYAAPEEAQVVEVEPLLELDLENL